MSENELIQPESEEIIDADIVPEQEEKKYQNDFIIPVKLDEEQEQLLMGEIRDEMTVIANEYSAEKYYENLKFAEREEKGINDSDKPENWKKLQLINLTSEIVASRGVRQTFGIRPFMLLEADEEMREEELRDMQDSIDYRMRNKIKLSEQDLIVYKKAGLEGAAIVKTFYCHDTETQRRRIRYKAGDGTKFINDNKDDDILNTPELFNKWNEIESLSPGEYAYHEKDIEVTRYKGAKTYRVPLDKFYARLSIKNFADHRLIAEEMNYRWKDIEARSESGYYDKKKVDKLKEQNGEEYYKNDYKIMEAIYFGDIKKEGKSRRYLITFDSESEIILRIIHYPYRDICYIPYCAMPRDDSWLGWSYRQKMKHTVSIAESFLNSTINESNIAHNFTVLTDDTTFEADRQTQSIDEGKINVISFAKGTTYKQLDFRYNPSDRVAIEQWSLQLTELVSGVSATLMSGAETPNDPHAPAAKTAMKMQTTNMRVEDVVISLQKGDEEVCRLTDLIDSDYSDNDEIVFYASNQQKKIATAVMQKKMRYQAQGSRLAFDKASDIAVVIQTVDFISKFAPVVLQDAEAIETIVSMLLNSSEGSIEKNKEKILKPLKIRADFAREEEKRKKLELEAIEMRQQQMRGGGIPQPQGMPANYPAPIPPVVQQPNEMVIQ